MHPTINMVSEFRLDHATQDLVYITTCYETGTTDNPKLEISIHHGEYLEEEIELLELEIDNVPYRFSCYLCQYDQITYIYMYTVADKCKSIRVIPEQVTKTILSQIVLLNF